MISSISYSCLYPRVNNFSILILCEQEILSLDYYSQVYPHVSHLLTFLALAFFGLLFLLMFTIGGSTAYLWSFPFLAFLGLLIVVLSLGAVIAIFSGISWTGEKIVGSRILLPSSSSTLSLYHLVSTFIGILLTFSPMHFLGFNVMPRRIPDFPDPFHSWNFLSSIGSGITFLSFAIFSY